MQDYDIKKITENSENSYIEFNEESIKERELAEEIVAFANFKDGQILIGVDDNGKTKGICDDLIEEKNLKTIETGELMV